MGKQPAFAHPFDTQLSSGLRFLVEVIAWVSGPWAASQLSVWVIVPALVLLIGLPSIFSTPGDKRQIVVATPGPLRVLLEGDSASVSAEPHPQPSGYPFPILYTFVPQTPHVPWVAGLPFFIVIWVGL